jgi:oligopeptide transport system substrate-binding protein
MSKLLVPLLVLAALIGATIATDRPAPRADITFISRDVTTLDLVQMSWQHDFRVARLLYEGLTRHDVLSREFASVPAVAERWDISPDGLTYTFHLRRDAQWSNGAPVKASDFRFAWRRVLLPDNAGDYAQLLTLVRGGQAFYDWRAGALRDFAADRSVSDRAGAAAALWEQTKARFDELVGVEAPDDHTLRVHLERPTPYFLDITGFAALYPVYEPLVVAHESIDPRTGALKTSPDWLKPGRLITNGPFVLTEWRFKRDMRFERNPRYWNAASLHIDTVCIPSIQDGNSQVLAFRTGAADWVVDVLPAYRAEMLEQKREFYREHQAEYDRLKSQGLDALEIDRRLPRDARNTIHAFPAFGTYFYNVNCAPRLADGRENPLADPRVRRALSLAIDKRAITDQIRRVGEPVADTFIPPGSISGYESPKGLSFDPARARDLLAQAGYGTGRALPTIEILFNKDGGHDLVAQAVARNWQEHLGVSTLLAMKEVKVFREELKRGNYMISRASWFGDYGDPTTFLDIHRSGDGNNDRRYANPAFDGLLKRAQDTRDEAERASLLSSAEKLLVEEDLPLIPLFHYVDVMLFDPHRVSGLSTHPRGEQNLYLFDVLGDGKGAKEQPTTPSITPSGSGP